MHFLFYCALEPFPLITLYQTSLKKQITIFLQFDMAAMWNLARYVIYELSRVPEWDTCMPTGVLQQIMSRHALCGDQLTSMPGVLAGSKMALLGRRGTALPQTWTLLSHHMQLLSDMEAGIFRGAATLAYETVCSKPQQTGSQPDKPTALVVHGLLGSG